MLLDDLIQEYRAKEKLCIEGKMIDLCKTQFEFFF